MVPIASPVHVVYYHHGGPQSETIHNKLSVFILLTPRVHEWKQKGGPFLIDLVPLVELNEHGGFVCVAG